MKDYDDVRFKEDEIESIRTIKRDIIEYIIKCIDETIHYRQTSLQGTNSKFKVGYTPLSFQIYYDKKGVAVNIDFIKNIFSEVYNCIKYEPSEEKRKIILQSL